MSMTSGSSFGGNEDLMSDINMTPLIDVMLVLLIILLITLPVLNNAIKVDLPKERAQSITQEEKSIDVAIKADGSLAWGQDPVDLDQFAARVGEAAQQEAIPVLRINADKAVVYERVATVLATAQKGGLVKIDFVTYAAP